MTSTCVAAAKLVGMIVGVGAMIAFFLGVQKAVVNAHLRTWQDVFYEGIPAGNGSFPHPCTVALTEDKLFFQKNPTCYIFAEVIIGDEPPRTFSDSTDTSCDLVGTDAWVWAAGEDYCRVDPTRNFAVQSSRLWTLWSDESPEAEYDKGIHLIVGAVGAFFGTVFLLLICVGIHSKRDDLADCCLCAGCCDWRNGSRAQSRSNSFALGGAGERSDPPEFASLNAVVDGPAVGSAAAPESGAGEGTLTFRFSYAAPTEEALPAFSSFAEEGTTVTGFTSAPADEPPAPTFDSTDDMPPPPAYEHVFGPDAPRDTSSSA